MGWTQGQAAGMQTGLRVLVVEDQQDIAANIWDFLERRGYVVDHAADGESGLARALAGTNDVIVLDLGLPRLDGLDLCRRLREAGHGVPVLMLTARDTLDDKLRGFAEGADDYLVKPFAMKELEARIRAVHRRGLATAGPALACGDLSFDEGSMCAHRAGHAIPLTRTQARLLVELLRAAPSIVPHRALIHAVWGEEGGDNAALQTHIYELRALVDKPFDRATIQTVHGIGYRLVATS